MNPAAAKARGFTYRVQPRHNFAAGIQHARAEISLNPPEALSRENELANGDQRARIRIVDLCELTCANTIASILASVRDSPQLIVVV